MKEYEENESCPICYEEFNSDIISRSVTPCGHFLCNMCLNQLFKQGNSSKSSCPICRTNFEIKEVENVKDANNTVDSIQINDIDRWGTKMANLIKYINNVVAEDIDNRIIVFSQWDSMLKMVCEVLSSSNIKYVFINGTIFSINCKIQKFKTDNSIRVVLMSSDKAASGLNLTEANHIILLDTVDTDKASFYLLRSRHWKSSETGPDKAC